MYGQAIAALTLAEAFKLTENEVFKSKLTPAVRFLERAQNPTSGGWRHVPYPDSNDTGDLSVTGWVIMGLESAKNAGVDVSNDCLKKANEYLDSVASGKENGLYGYKSKLPQKSMTAVGMFCRQLGEYKTNNQQKVSAEFLSTHFPRQDQRLRKSGHYHYWFYGTLALFSYGGDEWKNWHDRLIPILLNKQEQDGSWSPQGPRQRHEGRVVTTAWATLCMTVYYRCLPVIQKSTPGVRPEAGQAPQTEGRPGAQIQSEYSSRYRALRPQTR